MPRPKTIRDGLPRFRRVCRHLWPRMRQHRRLIAGSLGALFAGIILQLLEPWPLKFVLDSIIAEPQQADAAGSLGQGTSPTVLLTLCAIAVVTITGLRALADYYRTVGFALLGNRALTQMRGDVFRHLQGLSLSFHNQARNGDLIVRVTSDINMLKDVAVSAVLPLAASALMLIGMFAVMLWLNWQLTVLALAAVPFFWLTTVRLSRQIHDSARKQRRREGDMAATAAESMAGVKMVQALSLQGIFDQGFASHSQNSQRQGVRTSRLSASLERTVDLLIAIATALVLWFGAQFVLSAKMSPGDLIVFLTYLKRGFRPLQDSAKYAARLAKATAAGERVVEILERTSEVRDLPHAVKAPAFEGHIALECVRFGYEHDRAVLENIDLAIAPGERVAIVGPSGTGKSTLISLILRLHDPCHGQIKIDGRDIRDFTLASLRSQMGVVLQDNVLFAANVWDNIAYGNVKASKAEIQDAARLASAHDFIESLPEGYGTVLSERGVTLSHGQRQRIAIARAAIRNAPILLLDEPTTGLDEKNQQAVIHAIERLPRRTTTLIVTHDLAWAARTDRIIHLHRGTISEQGTHDELMLAAGLYANLFRMQTQELWGEKGAAHARAC